MATGIRIRVDASRIALDVAESAWLPGDLAKRAGVADMTVYRLLRGHRVTLSTAKKLAKALRKPVKRYLVVSEATEAVA